MKEDAQQVEVEKEDAQKENVKQEQKYHKQYKQECHTVPVPKTSVIPEQKCQDDSKQKYQTEYGKKS